MTITKIKNFTDLEAWQEAHKLVLLVYQVTKKYPREERFSLVDQTRRCTISISSNIAEGFSRHGIKEKIQFYYVAKGSLTELQNQLLVAKDIGYIKPSTFEQITAQSITVHKLINGLIRSLNTRYKLPNTK
ncbi:hypothetical protein A2210_00160 [Candidatus Woesebacteria bacterium RIFOXYA1_FULL_40_18]|uniref:Four helix bundle protein n=1 Tax=Candidatus Woesebacteria bacterium RIFOXYA1_FULL_40_18 TaxID=1802532 RepID=A0A1F8CLZ2_9BACT|nr:MAG: hypothetical protein A2210_00160 [Candidatus Woesebacteria bacterium RIFOXYA1_FULL_40_18]